MFILKAELGLVSHLLLITLKRLSVKCWIYLDLLGKVNLVFLVVVLGLVVAGLINPVLQNNF